MPIGAKAGDERAELLAGDDCHLAVADGGAPAAGSRLPLAVVFILMIEFCERLAYYGASLLFMGYMQHMLGWDLDVADSVANAFSFWAYATALLGGFMADQYWGKVKTIAFGASVYVVGLALLVVSALPLSWAHFPNDATGFGRPGFAVALFLIGLGTGAIKANVSTLVADQLGDCTAEEHASVFRWFYWAINLGAFVGQLVTPLLHQHRIFDRHAPRGAAAGDDAADQGTSYWLAFAFPLLSFVVALAIFFPLACRGTFSDRRPQGSLIRGACAACCEALRARRAARAAGDASQRAHWLDWAAGSEHGSMAADVKQVLRACRVFVVFPVYWLMYNQMQTNFIAQADWLEKPAWLSSEALNVLDPAFLIIFIPVFDHVIFPALRRRGHAPNAVQRITIGFFLSGLVMVWVFVVQVFVTRRGSFAHDSDGDYTLHPGQEMVSVWWQAVPYPLFALSEIFASVGGLEFAYAEAPASMKSIVMALYLLTTAGGSLIGIIMTPVIKPANLVGIFAAFSAGQLVLTVVFHALFRNYRGNGGDPAATGGLLDGDERESADGYVDRRGPASPPSSHNAISPEAGSPASSRHHTAAV